MEAPVPPPPSPRRSSALQWAVSLAALPAAGALGFALSQNLRYREPMGAVLTEFALALLIVLPPALSRRRREAGGTDDAGHGSTLPFLVAGLAAAALFVEGKFHELTAHMDGKATLGSLGSLRSSLSIYYGDMEGHYPSDFRALSKDQKYILHELPLARTAAHRHSAGVVQVPSFAPTDGGAWGYVNGPADPNFGKVFVDCTHTDTRGTVWTEY